MSDLVGQYIGRYHILERLGEGGMATVYKAFDTRLEADVAIKVIRMDELPPKVLDRALKRFAREAKALARLTHPNIVRVIDAGEHEGAPYLVMPYLPGGNLKQVLRERGQLPWQEALQLLIPVARALGYAHRQGMIHRDVKPSNILITEDGELILTDFGIAKILSDEDTVDLTGTRGIVGTPEYMAPEQVTSTAVDARVDIYALGIMLYEMVTGRKPYQADTPMAVMIKHARDPLPRPREFVPELPEEVERILLKALAKDPDERYQTADELALALQQVLQRSGRRRQTAIPGAWRIPFLMTVAILIIGGAIATISEHARDNSSPQRPASFIATADSTPGVAATPTTALPSSRPVPPTSSATGTPDLVLTNTPDPQATNAAAALANAKRLARLTHLSGKEVSQVTYSANGALLAMSTSTGILLYNARTLQEIRSINTGVLASGVALSPEARFLAAGLEDGTVRVWQVRDGALLQVLEGHTNLVWSVAFSPDGANLASGAWDGVVRLWRLRDGTLLRTFKGHTGPVWSVAFSPAGGILASGSDDGTVRLWRLRDGTLVHVLRHRAGPVRSVAFSPDGRILASGLDNETVQLWDVRSGTPLLTLKGHTGPVWSVAFSPSRRTIASGSEDSTVRLWQLDNGAALHTLEGHIGTVWSIAFSPDGETLTSVSGSEAVSAGDKVRLISFRLVEDEKFRLRGAREFRVNGSVTQY